MRFTLDARSNGEQTAADQEPATVNLTYCLSDGAEWMVASGICPQATLSCKSQSATTPEAGVLKSSASIQPY